MIEARKREVLVIINSAEIGMIFNLPQLPLSNHIMSELLRTNYYWHSFEKDGRKLITCSWWQFLIWSLLVISLWPSSLPSDNFQCELGSIWGHPNQQIWVPLFLQFYVGFCFHNNINQDLNIKYQLIGTKCECWLFSWARTIRTRFGSCNGLRSEIMYCTE